MEKDVDSARVPWDCQHILTIVSTSGRLTYNFEA